MLNSQAIERKKIFAQYNVIYMYIYEDLCIEYIKRSIKSITNILVTPQNDKRFEKTFYKRRYR